ncbi:MAG: hypothetical protein JSS91_00845 [Bacteroidetes bacterium]|nr:hypothetical protein [Bacteroidota bacterium]
MPNFTVWYKKEVKAKNIKEAVSKEKKVKPVFHSIIEEEVNQGTSAIGFNYED